jgi:hypothetical protein
LIAEAGRLRESNRGGSPKVETPHAGDSHRDLIVAVAAGVLEHEKHGAPPKARTLSSFRVRLEPRLSEQAMKRVWGDAYVPGVTRAALHEPASGRDCQRSGDLAAFVPQ